MATVGRPRIFETPADLEQAWNLYKKETQEEKKEWIDKVGFCEFVDCYIGILANLAKRQEFSTVLNQIDADCKRDVIKRSLLNEYNSTIAKLILSADYGMAEKTESKQDIKATVDIKDFRNNLIDH